MVERKRLHLTKGEFLEKIQDRQVRQAAERLMAVAIENGGYVDEDYHGIRLRYPDSVCWNYPITVAWLYPGERRWFSYGEFVFGMPIPGKGSESLPREVRKALQIWFDSFEDDDFSEDISTVFVEAWAVSHESAVRHIDELAERLKAVLSWVRFIDEEDKADYRAAVKASERIRQGKEKVYTEAEVRAHLGLDS